MEDSRVTGGYSSSFWMNKVFNLAAVLASVWIVLWLADEEKDPERSIAKIILYIAGFVIASVGVWNALKFIFNWEHDETRMISADRSSDGEADDLTEIEGVGPKINSLLQEAGFNTFEDVANAKKSELKAVLDDAGERFRVHDPTSWPQQAALAAEGEWAKLHALQEELVGGK